MAGKFYPGGANAPQPKRAPKTKKPYANARAVAQAHAALDAVERESVLQSEINALRAENKALKSKLRALRQIQEYNNNPVSRGCCDVESVSTEGYDA